MQDEETKKPRYTVISVEKTTPPEGTTGENWHRYEIGQGTSKIVGKKPGSLKEITQHAETMAEDLNSRTGSGNSVYAPRKKS